VYIDSSWRPDTNEVRNPRLGGMDKKFAALFGIFDVQPDRSATKGQTIGGKMTRVSRRRR